MRTVFALLLFIFPIATLTFIVRLVCASFSAKVSAEMRQHLIVHWIWGGLAFLGMLVILGVLDPMWWPPPSIERRGQRQKVLERVNAAGGWAAIQRDCDALATQYRDGEFFWHRGETNKLPPALAALNPWEVRFTLPTSSQDSKDEPQVAVVHIKIFGIHSTGGHSTPYFGLEVVSGSGAEIYKPRPSAVGASGNGYGSYNPVTERIYEVY
jgi:hypothetical protein